MPDLATFTEKLRFKNQLNATEAEACAHFLTSEMVDASEKKDFLEALHAKGESVEEVAAFARVFRQLATNPGMESVAPYGIDIVGTGGSASGGYNVSSVAAFIVAAAGVPVLKHGNRAITSKSGSADFLALFGIPLTSDLDLLKRSVEKLNFCFFFAPAFHPAFKAIMPVRKAMAEEKKRSIFNILGPLINPAQPQYQLLGVYSKDWVDPLAACLHELGLARGLAVNSQLPDGRRMDEFTTAGTNYIRGFGDLATFDEACLHHDFDMPLALPSDLSGGSAQENLELLNLMMEGKGPSGLADTIILNAGSAFFIANKSTSIIEGCALAKEVLLDGQLHEWIESAKSFYSNSK